MVGVAAAQPELPAGPSRTGPSVLLPLVDVEVLMWLYILCAMIGGATGCFVTLAATYMEW